MGNTPFSANKLFLARQAHHRAIECATRYGLCFVAYGAIIQTVNGPQEVMINNYPPGWNEYYMDSGYKDCDPVIEHALSSSIHSIWTPAMYGKSILSKKMFDDTIDAGLRAGITIPVRDHRGNIASVNFSGRTREPLLFWSEDRIGYLYFVANVFHVDVAQSYLSEVKVSNDIHISPREQEVLKFAAIGKTTWELSRILRVAESTVEYHLKNIRDKLDAANTTHAIFKAAKLNLIELSSDMKG